MVVQKLILGLESERWLIACVVSKSGDVNCLSSGRGGFLVHY
jgi:hypothetical protein